MIDDLSKAILNSQSIAILTGAGISVNAGIPDFRGEQGIYTTGKYSEHVFDIDYFVEDPKIFYDFAREMYPIFESAQPTKAHKFIKELEKYAEVYVITQNIDLLHKKAGTKNVIYLHGCVKDNFCMNCGKQFSFDEMKTLIFKESVPHCDKCGGLIKPDIVFFGEPVKDFDKAAKWVSDADVFFSLGTSLEVYPANMLVDFAKGARVIVNKQLTRMDDEFDFVFHEDLDEFASKLESILKGGKE